MTLLPTPQAHDAKGFAGEGFNEGNLPQVVRDRLTLLPTPRAQARDGIYAREDHHNNLEEILGYLHEGRGHEIRKGSTGTPGPNQRGSSGDLMLPSAVQQLLPTPTAMDALGSRNSTAWRSDPDKPVNIGDTLTDFAWKHDGHHDPRMPASEPMQGWGDYAAAIARWEHATGRTAPAPTEPGKNGNPRLSPAFVEWLMGLPEGHITDPAIGLTRNAQLKAAGNGVVPQQAAEATRWWLAQVEAVPA